MHDLIIIGSGPAGLSAAVYAVRAGLDVLVFEQNPMSGGQILNTYEVDNYLGLPGINGFDMGEKFRSHADKLGAKFINAKVKAVTDMGEYKLLKTRKEEFEAKAIIFATGTQNAKLGIPGEEEFIGRGVSYCATCDGAFYKGKNVMVVGGGDVALEDAIYLARTSSKVYIVHRRDSFRGAPILEKELRSFSNVEFIMESIVTKVEGDTLVQRAYVENVVDGRVHTVDIDGIFIAVGNRPNTELLEGLVSLDEKGYVVSGEDCITDRPGIFVAGDLRAKPLRQVVTAVSDGANAATSAAAYIVK